MQLTHQDILEISKKSGLSDSESCVLSAFFDAQGTQPQSVSYRTSDLLEQVQWSRQYLVRVLGGLVKKNILERRGQGPQTHYRIHEETVLRLYLDVHHLLRSPKPFRIAEIEGYDPSLEGQFLAPPATEELSRWSESAISRGDTLNDIVFRRFMIDFAYASSRMEGNRYSLVDTRLLLNQGIEAKGKASAEAAMIRNHANALDYLIKNAREMPLTAFEVRQIHALLSQSLLPDPADVGRGRRHPVQINKSAYQPPAMPQTLTEGLDLICKKASRIANPYEQSLFLLAQISRLQPFIDVNKRTARVFSNLPLLKGGLCPLSFYNMDDTSYINGLLAFYETGSPALLARAYVDGYEASVERFRSYRLRLADDLEINAQDQERKHQVLELVRRFVIAVATGREAPGNEERFFRSLMQEEEPLARDSILVEAVRTLRGLDLAQAVHEGLPADTFWAYRNAVRLQSRLLMDDEGSGQENSPDTDRTL